MVLGQQECCCGGVALSVLINKDKAALPWKTSYFHSSCLFKRQGQGQGRVLSDIWMPNLHMSPCPASTSRNSQEPPDPLLAQSLVVCTSERGMKKRNWKENEQRGTILKRTQIYSICTFPSVSSMENNFTFPALCVRPQRWLAPKGTHQPFPPAHVWSCSHLGLNFNPLVQADELHESSSADSSWLSSFCLACFIVWALDIPALPSAHTFGFWLTRGLRQRDSVCHLESSMTWSQVVTQIPQTVRRIDHKFLQ